jgi:hypothetical protein
MHSRRSYALALDRLSEAGHCVRPTWGLCSAEEASPPHALHNVATVWGRPTRFQELPSRPTTPARQRCLLVALCIG